MADRPLELSSAQRKTLRGLAHDLSPRVRLGHQGLTEEVLAAIDAELSRHELIKVRVVGERVTRLAMCTAIAARLACAHAGTVGHVAILYRPHPDPEKRKIGV